MVELYEFQKKAVAWLLTKPRGVLGSEMGLGKTATALRAADQVPGLKHIVCPASLKGNWQREMKLWTPDFGPYQIYSYEYYRDHIKEIVQQPRVIIFDEVHYLKNRLAKRTKAALNLEAPARRAKFVWGLTGTPFPNCIADCHTFFNFCLRGELGKFWTFAERYAYIRDTDWGKKASGQRRSMLPELMEKVRSVMYRDTVAENLKELPAYQEISIPLKPTPAVKEIEKDLEEFAADVLKAIENGSAPPKDPIIARLRRLEGMEKICQAADFVKDLIEESAPVVVFAYHKDVVRGLARKLHAAYIDGDTPMKDRDTTVTRFQEGKLPCVVLSITAASVGITLTKSHVCVFAEVDYAPATLTQAMARIRRIGQTEICLYYFLVFPDTLDERVLDTMSRKTADLKLAWKVWNREEVDLSDPNEVKFAEEESMDGW